MGKAAKDWDKWCKAYAKHPQRAMKEKGHSRTSSVLRKLNLKKKDASSDEEHQTTDAGAAEDVAAENVAAENVAAENVAAENVAVENDTTPVAATSRKAKLVSTLRKKKAAMLGGLRGSGEKA